MPLKPPRQIDSKRLRLRPVQESDIPDLMKVNGDDEVTRFLPYASWRSIEDGKAWFERMSNLGLTSTVLQFVIVEKKASRIIGTCLLFRYDESSARIEIGYVMGRAHWGKGFTHEALSALLSYTFEVYQLRRVEAEVDPRNIASNRLLLKLGFVCEGLLRKRWVGKGNPYDTNIYGLLRDEWPPGRQ